MASFFSSAPIEYESIYPIPGTNKSRWYCPLFPKSPVVKSLSGTNKSADFEITSDARGLQQLSMIKL